LDPIPPLERAGTSAAWCWIRVKHHHDLGRSIWGTLVNPWGTAVGSLFGIGEVREDLGDSEKIWEDLGESGKPLGNRSGKPACNLGESWGTWEKIGKPWETAVGSVIGF